MFNLDYDNKFDTIVDKIKKINDQNIILQFREGLKADTIDVFTKST